MRRHRSSIFSARSLLAAALLAPAVLFTPPAARGQVVHAATVSRGGAFTIDMDDPDAPGSLSLSASVERRRPGRALSWGLEAGFHRYLAIRQHLEPDVSGWANTLEQDGEAWRLTPYLRWRTGGNVGLYAQVGAGLYLRRAFYFQQERQWDEVTHEVTNRISDLRVGAHLGLGLELFPGRSPIGVSLGVRSHAGGIGFNTGEIGLVWRGGGTRAPRETAEKNRW